MDQLIQRLEDPEACVDAIDEAIAALQALKLHGDVLAACLRKYQGRFHESPHAKKDHERGAAALKQWEEVCKR